MIYYFCAIYAEAAPLIQRYRCKKNIAFRRFQVYEGEQTYVIITGTGPFRAAAVVTEFFTTLECKNNSDYLPSDQEPLLVNVGLAGYPIPAQKTFQKDTLPQKGTLLLIHKITDDMTKKDYYPDLLYKHPFSEIALQTVPLPQLNGFQNTTENTLIDMEAAAIYQAGIRFLKPSQMVFFKVISDYCDSLLPTKKEIVQWMENASKKISLWCDALENSKDNYKETRNDHTIHNLWNTEITKQFQTLLNLWDCSVTMENALHQYFDYALHCKKTDADIKLIIQNIMAKKPLSKDSKAKYTRKDGKQFLEQFRQQLLQ